MASNTDKLVHHCTNLEPEMTYEIAVSAINGAGESGNITVITTTACEGICRHSSTTLTLSHLPCSHCHTYSVHSHTHMSIVTYSIHVHQPCAMHGCVSVRKYSVIYSCNFYTVYLL